MGLSARGLLTTALAIMLVMLLLPLADSHAATDGPTANLVSTDSRIVLVKYIGIGSTDEKPTFYLDIINTGDAAATDVRIISSSLTIKEGGRFSSAPSYILPEELTISPDSIAEIPAGKSQQVTFTLDRITSDEAVYQGELLIIRQNSEPVKVDIRVSFIDSPWVYIGFALLGIFLATLFGFWYGKMEKETEIVKKIDDDTEIIEHINSHLKSIDVFRNNVPAAAWAQIEEEYKVKKNKIVAKRDDFALEEDDEDVKWFENVDELVHKTKFFSEPIPGAANKELGRIELSQELDVDRQWQLYAQKVQTARRYERERNWREAKKKLYLFASISVASFVTVFTSINFLGSPVVNAVVATSVGFSIYRAQDLLKILNSNLRQG